MDAAHLMTLDVTCIDEDTPIGLAWDLMKRQRVRHLPVIDQGKLVGIISDRDLLERVRLGVDGRLYFPELCAAEVMVFDPVSCAPDAEIPELAAKMLERHIDSMPVVSPEGALLGLVTSTDLLRLLAQRVEVAPRAYPST